MKTQHLLQTLPEGPIRLQGNYAESTLRINGKKLSLSKSLKLVDKSPTGFAWGYGGSGPAQTALAILLEFLPKETALEYYQAFKYHYVATLPMADFDEMVSLRDVMKGILQQHPSQLKTGKLF